mgnify:CR=1 FL=1
MWISYKHILCWKIYPLQQCSSTNNITNFLNNKPVDITMKKYGYLISYIRQSVLRYGEESRRRMRDVGIKLSQKQVAAIILKLRDITIPQKICYQNRYWDPLVLETIYTEFDGEVPITPYERGARAKLDYMMRFLRDINETSSMYRKHIPEKYQSGKMRGIMVSLCMKWIQEKNLKDILSDKRYEELSFYIRKSNCT